MKNRVIIRILVPVCFLGAALALVAYQHAINKDEELLRGNTLNQVVVEFFTSPDCKKCTDANALITSLLSEEKLIALTYPVAPETTQGSENSNLSLNYKNYHNRYARKFRSNSYIPELILNGKERFSGQGNHVLNGHLTADGLIANLDTPFVYRTSTSVNVNYNFENNVPGAQLFALLVQETATVTSTNNNATVKSYTYTNLVVEKITLDVTIIAGTFSLKLPENAKSTDRFKVVLLLQDAMMEIKAASISKSC